MSLVAFHYTMPCASPEISPATNNVEVMGEEIRGERDVHPARNKEEFIFGNQVV